MTITSPKFHKNLTRFLWAAILVLALLAGLYHSYFRTEQRKYQYLEDRYVRLEMMVGASDSARLIEESYQIIDNQGQKL